MGCCTGRCTLAFICGMQLVSVKTTIDPIGEWTGISQEKGTIFDHEERHAFAGLNERRRLKTKDGWMEGEKTNG